MSLSDERNCLSLFKLLVVLQIKTYKNDWWDDSMFWPPGQIAVLAEFCIQENMFKERGDKLGVGPPNALDLSSDHVGHVE